MNASLFYTRESPVDIACQVASILDFLSEVLGNTASGSNEGLSSQGTDGLASICMHLSLICREAAERSTTVP